MKGIVPLLEALAKVRTERADAHLVLVGKPRENSPVAEMVERLGLAGAVRWLSSLSERELVGWYLTAELCVVPSLYEGFSLPAVEAMACGVPLVTTTGGALPEVVGRDGETALLVAPNDPGALAGSILRCLDDVRLRARLGAAGRRRTLERFAWPVTAKRTAEEYRALLAACNGPFASRC
jgi:glycosyltransferase involved in cell wall biosynthesis